MTSKFAKKSTSSDFNETWHDIRGRWDIHDDMTFNVIRGQGQGEEMTSVPYRDYFSGTVPVWSGLSRCPKGSIQDIEMFQYSANGPGSVRATEMSSHCVDIKTARVWRITPRPNVFIRRYVICLCITLAYWRNNLRIARNGHFAKEVRKGMTVQFQHELKIVILSPNLSVRQTDINIQPCKIYQIQFRALILWLWMLVISWCKG